MRLMRRVLSRLGSADLSAPRLLDLLRSGGLNDCRSAWSVVRNLRRRQPHARPDGSYAHGSQWRVCSLQVREHLICAFANGMAAHGGVLPLAVAYLAFLD